MDHFQQRVVVMFLFLKELRHKAAHAELSSVLGEQAGSFSKRSDGSVCSGLAIFHLKTMIGPGGRSRNFRMEFNQDRFSCRYCARITEGKLELQAQS
jgi:hypothetical protein